MQKRRKVAAEGNRESPWAVSVETLRQRAKIVSSMRAFFDGQGFVEVETPVRIDAPAPEPHIDCPEVLPPRSNRGAITYLRASPELQMKKLLAAGMDKIYQIGPCFRENERGSRHNPEFTMMEWYRRDAGYRDILSDMESLFAHLLSLMGRDLPPAKRMTVREAYRLWAGWDPWTGEWDQDRFDIDMATKIEPALANEGAVFLLDYPRTAASLAKLREDDDVAERWEFYVNGIELANCFTELCDSEEQRLRFLMAKEDRRSLGEADYPLDEEFIEAIDGIGSAAGVALGVDRLVMVLLGLRSISASRVL